MAETSDNNASHENGNGNGNGEAAPGDGEPIDAVPPSARASAEPSGLKPQQTLDHEPDRSAQPVDGEEPPRLPFPVVGIGGSAGGLEAFMAFFQVMPPDAGMAYVVVQHLPPDRESMMVDILSKHTAMPVCEVEDGMPVEADHVYVIRPGHRLTIKDGHLHLHEQLGRHAADRPVDDFFKSLAEEQRERAVCIIMSGMGSNGTLGAQSLKVVGGVAIAQDPESAKFPSMPQSLIDTHFADFILRPEEMPLVLMRYAKHPYARERRGGIGADVRRDAHHLNDALNLLRTRLHQDFTSYKRPTLYRRVQRRMGLNQVAEMGDYVRLLRQNSRELTALADDLLIHVTGFFRDAEAWESLRSRVVVPLVRERPSDSSIRCWVAACSTGEEAYTLAILIDEEARRLGKSFDVKIFATDMAERSLNHARGGVYPGGIETEIAPERLERYFERQDAVYRIKQTVRQMVVFAPQNILQDPPFSRIDIVTCRNLLIYLEPPMQQRVLSTLHFSLRADGALFLGSSETTASVDGLFEPIDQQRRIYKRAGPGRSIGGNLRGLRSGPGAPPPRPFPVPSARRTIAQLTEKVLLERHTPAAVTIDPEQRIVFFHGHTDPFLSQPRGEPTSDLLTMTREPLRSAVRTAVHKAMSTRGPATIRAGNMQTREGPRRVLVTAAPLGDAAAPGFHLVSFETVEPEPAAVDAPAGDAADDGEVQRLRAELLRSRADLQETIDTLQATIEAMHASNEEATSVNEELQSTNEELETSKEELQSLNEELNTVNAQLQLKMDEHAAATNDLSTLLTSTTLGVIFLDVKLRIRRFTPSTRDLFDLIPNDVGRPLADLFQKFNDPTLMEDAQAVLDRLIPVEREVSAASGRWYLRRALPYRTIDNRIDGVVLTFSDITDRHDMEAQRQAGDDRYRLIVEGLREYAIFMMDLEGRITTWNTGSENLLGFRADEAIGQHSQLIFVPEDRATNEAEKELERARTTGHSINERWHIRKNGTRFWGSGICSALRDEAGGIRALVKVMRDNTERQLAEERLDEARRAAEAANEAKDQFLATVSHELRTPLSVILLWSKMMRAGRLQPDQLGEGLEAILRGAEAQKQLIDDLLDTSRISAGKLRLNMVPVEVTSVLMDAIDAIGPTATAKGIELAHEFEEGIGVVRADPDRLQQIVWNLLANAVKFTPGGGRVAVTGRRIGGDIEIRVIDNGQGIPPEFLPRLFHRFHQGEAVTTRTQGGLGLGLAIVKQLVELHGGAISAESAGVGQGSTFIVRLPLAQIRRSRAASGPRPPPRPDVVAASGPPLRDVRILVVEDNAENARAISTLLQGMGAVVTHAESGRAGLDAMAGGARDVIISDIAMPEMDGYTFIRRVREIERESGVQAIPAIALSAFARDEDRIRAIESGFQHHLAKPLDIDKLISAITTLVSPR